MCVQVCVSDERPLNIQTTLQGYFYSFLWVQLPDGGLRSFITKRLFLLRQNQSWLFCVFCLWIEQDSLNDPFFEHGPFTVQIICQKRPALILTLTATTSEDNVGRKRRRKRWTEDCIFEDRQGERESDFFLTPLHLLSGFQVCISDTAQLTFLKWPCQTKAYLQHKHLFQGQIL